MPIVDNGSQHWSNFHATIVKVPITLKTVYNPLIGTLKSLQPLFMQIQQLIDSNEGRLRAYGARWSLSGVASADTNGTMLETSNMNQVFRMNNYLDNEYRGTAETIRLFQAGISVRAMNDFLNVRGYSLKTSGASDGQTLAGAISTGTHGSAFSFGSMQEFVVGIHIICGQGKNYWLERASYPVANETLLKDLNATAIQDDEIFNAALVSFGSFGFIHALAVEFEPKYNLELYRERVSHIASKKFLEQLFALNESLDSKAIDSIFSGIGKECLYLHHIEVDINPHDPTSGFISVMYKTTEMEELPFCDSSGIPGNETITVIGEAVNILGDVFGNWLSRKLIPHFSSTITSQFQLCKPYVRLPRGEMFAPTNASGGIMSVELGVSHKDARVTLDVLLTLNSSIPFAGVFSFRFVKQTNATLGFTKFPITCCIEIPGVGCAATEEFYSKLYLALDAAGIEFTLHWGQMNDYQSGGSTKVRKRWGNTAVDAWIAARERLLDTQLLRDRFSNQLLQDCGLNSPVPVSLPAVIAGDLAV